MSKRLNRRRTNRSVLLVNSGPSGNGWAVKSLYDWNTFSKTPTHKLLSVTDEYLFGHPLPAGSLAKALHVNYNPETKTTHLEYAIDVFQEIYGNI